MIDDVEHDIEQGVYLAKVDCDEEKNVSLCETFGASEKISTTLVFLKENMAYVFKKGKKLSEYK